MLELKSFKKSYGSQLILDIPEVEMTPGIHWVKGKNGSGKSTLFNCLAGLSPYKGTIKVDGFNLQTSARAYKLKVGYSQSEPIFPEFLSGYDLIDFFEKLKKSPKGQADRLIEQFDVANYAEKPCGTYSSGMLKKISIILAFLGTPSWIILDEPLVMLDKEAQHLVASLIESESQKGTSFIFATHQDFENTHISATNIYETKDGNLLVE